MTLTVCSFKIERELLEELDNIAKRMNVSRSVVIRNAIREYLTKFKDVKTYESGRLRFIE
jgi:Ribbon-helix-helix protein, copG family.